MTDTTPARTSLAASGGWVAAFLVIAAVILWFSPPGAGGSDGARLKAVYAQGYAQIIDRIFVSNQWLKVDLGGGASAPLVSVDPDALKLPEVQSFYRASFLKEDVESRNPDLWRFQGANVIGVSDSAHAIRLPFAQNTFWKGDLDFREASDEGISFTGQGQTWTLEPKEVRTDAPDVPAGRIELFQSRSQPAPAQRASKLDLQTGGARVGQVFLAGGAVILRLSNPDVEVWIEGRKIVAQEGAAAYARLDPGARLLFRRIRDNRTVHFSVAAESAAISRYRLLSGRTRSSSTGAFGLGFEQAMDTAVSEGAAGEALNVTTTLDAGLQSALQSELEIYCQRGRQQAGGGLLRAAITVMDIGNGDILSLASFPRTAEQLGARGPGQSRLLQSNQNFARLSIGSTAKAPFATALAQRFPGLTGLSIPGGYAGHDMDDLFGIDLQPTLEEHGVPVNPIGFEDFLARSSNRYAATLMLLGASPDPFADGTLPADQAFTLGRSRSMLPELVFDSTKLRNGRYALSAPANFTSDIVDPNRPDARTWPWWLGNLFDLPLVEGVTGGDTGPESDASPLLGGAFYDLQIWRPLLRQLKPQAMAAFRDTSVSPEREWFGMNVLRNFRTDYLNLIIGGGRSRWTTIKLAESYARIVTDRRVKANIVLRVGEREVPVVQPEALGLSPSIRAPLLNGLFKVGTEGTAASPRLDAAMRRLNALAARRGEQVTLYSKTGTPTLETWAPTASGRAVEGLFAANLLRRRADGRIAIGDAAAAVAPVDRATTVQAEALLTASQPARSVLAQWGVTATQAVAYVKGYNLAPTPAKKSLWLGFSQGRVVAAARRDKPDDKGRLYVFVLTRKPLGAAGPGSQGVVVVVNIQDSWPVNGRGTPTSRRLPENVATALGTELLEKGVFDSALWPEGVPITAQGGSVGGTV